MNIYPISEQIERLMESFIDPETGEITATEEEMQTAIEQAQLDFDAKIADLRNAYINLTAEAEAIQAEKLKLAVRQKRAEESAARLKRWLAYLLHGEKYQKDAVKISYRASEEVKFEDDDPQKFVLWADKNFPSLLKYKAPEPSKSEIKKAIKAGLKVDFARIEKKSNIQIT